MQTPELTRLIDDFKDTAIQRSQASESGDRHVGIDVTMKCIRYGDQLVRFGGAGIDALCRLCEDDDARIRYMSACMLMEIMPRVAERTLIALKELQGKVGAKASVALEVWEDGYWPL